MAWTQYRCTRTSDGSCKSSGTLGPHISGCSQATIDDPQELAAHVKQFLADNPYKEGVASKSVRSERWSDVDPQREVDTSAHLTATPTPSEAALALEAIRITSKSEADRAQQASWQVPATRPECAGAPQVGDSPQSVISEADELRTVTQQYLCPDTSPQVAHPLQMNAPQITTPMQMTSQRWTGNMPVGMAIAYWNGNVPVFVPVVDLTGYLLPQPQWVSGPHVDEHRIPVPDEPSRDRVQQGRRGRSRSPYEIDVQEDMPGTEEEWEERLAKRLVGLSDLKEADCYKANKHMKGARRPQTPDYQDRSLSKRKWEKLLGKCRLKWRIIYCEQQLTKKKIPKSRIAGLSKDADGYLDVALRLFNDGK